MSDNQIEEETIIEITSYPIYGNYAQDSTLIKRMMSIGKNEEFSYRVRALAFRKIAETLGDADPTEGKLSDEELVKKVIKSYAGQ